MEEMINMLEKEFQRITGMLSFLVEEESLIEKASGMTKQIQARNMLRLAVTKKWADAMLKQTREKYPKEVIKSVDDILKLVEIKKN